MARKAMVLKQQKQPKYSDSLVCHSLNNKEGKLWHVKLLLKSGAKLLNIKQELIQDAEYVEDHIQY